MKRLFLLDAYGLIYRAYYALINSPRRTTSGMNTSAIFGFCNTLREVLEKEDPTHIAVCFDPPGPTFRHQMYDQYKAGRDKQPEDITTALPWIRRILHALNIPCVTVEGYEADDVIGTLSRRAAAEGYQVYMMTLDKDYGQLVDDNVFMYRPSLRGEGFEVRGPRQVCEKYGISSPSQVLDMLALEGDASDNIPGCPKVGEKTAQKLIAEYGSVAGVLEHAADIKGKLGERIRDNAEQIRLSYQLAAIKTDCPIDISISGLLRKPMNLDELLGIYKELEFKTFTKRLMDRAPSGATEQRGLFDAEPGEAEPKGAFAAPVVAPSPGSAYEVGELAARLARDATRLAAFFVALGDEAMTADLRCVAFSWEQEGAPAQAVRVDLPRDAEPKRQWVQALAPAFAGDRAVACHDCKRGMVLLHCQGVEWTAPLADTAVAHYLIDPEMKHDLVAVAAKVLGADALPDLADPCRDAAATLALAAPLEAEVAARGMTPLLRDVELPMVRVLASMEVTGVRIDPSVLVQLRRELNGRLEELETEAFAMAGEPFNPFSPKQVGEILFEKLKIDPAAKKTSSGGYSTAETTLEKYRATVPLVDLIMKMRKLRKLIATYLDTLPTLVNPRTGKLHTTFNQTVTATGRISSSDPNLQNIPIRGEDGREIRRAFIADPGDLFMSADYSQIELRIIADLSQDREMIQSFLSGEDIHRATAAKIYHETLEQVTDDQRRHAKTANFGIIYGISAFGLSQRLGIPRAEAKALIDGYFNTYPHIRAYLDRSIATAREKGYVSTKMGRRRRLPDISSRSAAVRGWAERNAVNAPIQGTAADIIKVAMVAIWREIKTRGLRSRMIMQVHDELLFNVVPEELDQLKELVVRLMTDAYHGAVPLEVSAGVADNWLEAH